MGVVNRAGGEHVITLRKTYFRGLIAFYVGVGCGELICGGIIGKDFLG